MQTAIREGSQGQGHPRRLYLCLFRWYNIGR